MKKLLSMLLALSMLLSCIAFADDPDYTGVWRLTGATSGNSTYGLAELEEIGVADANLTIYADGTAVMAQGTAIETYKWTQSDSELILSDGNSTVLLTYQDGVLHYVEGGSSLMFTHEGAAPAVDDPPAPEVVDYTGVWVVTGMETDGLILGPRALDAMMDRITLTVYSDGTVALSNSYANTWVETESGLYLPYGASSVLLTYQDGVLYQESNGDTLMFTREGAAPAVDDTIAAVLAQVEPAAFEGKWLLTHVFNTQTSAAGQGLYIALELSNGQCLYTSFDENNELATIELPYTVEEVEDIGTVLTIFATDATTGEQAAWLTLNMLADGSLYELRNDTGTPLDFFYTRQAEEAAE